MDKGCPSKKISREDGEGSEAGNQKTFSKLGKIKLQTSPESNSEMNWITFDSIDDFAPFGSLAFDAPIKKFGIPFKSASHGGGVKFKKSRLESSVIPVKLDFLKKMEGLPFRKFYKLLILRASCNG